jgi:hypothetical protein
MLDRRKKWCDIEFRWRLTVFALLRSERLPLKRDNLGCDWDFSMIQKVSESFECFQLQNFV